MQWSVAIVINRIDPRSMVDEELDCELNTMQHEWAPHEQQQ
jgi:hypothetical protein